MSIEINPEEIKKEITRLRKILLILQKWLALIMENRPIVIIHHSGTSRDNTHFSAIEHGHFRKKYPRSKLGYYCAYNTLITGGGKIHRARTYDENGEGTGAFKGFHLDICLTGNFNHERPSDRQLESLQCELDVIEQLYGSCILKVHQDYYPTECCGKNLISWVKGLKINK